jgi:hypothetical protein
MSFIYPDQGTFIQHTEQSVKIHIENHYGRYLVMYRYVMTDLDRFFKLFPHQNIMIFKLLSWKEE